MSVSSFLQAFLTVFPAELPDKTLIATVLLVARYRRPGWVWVGAVSAFAVHVVVAVAAGSALGLLPDVVVQAVVAALFAAGAFLLFRAARVAEADATTTADSEARFGGRATVVGSFGLVIIAEWGDLTQLATASLAASSGARISTGAGALVALAAVAGIAATCGRQLVSRVAIHKVSYVGAAIFAGLAVWTIAELLL